ncbi:MAG: type IV secretory system conjugative DNA transfer family protein [Actinomycetota bacterium]|nr:MAG: type IV secretory system conjugative DNA transfer family protein [Actinomycetota bacterium]
MFYAGNGVGGPVFLPRESHLLVLGPPRSGKTRSIVVPNILMAPGPVIATSTKSDLIEATHAERSAKGRVYAFDPSGSVPLPPNVERVQWSPISPNGTFSSALAVTRAMIDASMLVSGHQAGYSHWIERASSLVAPLIHAAQIGGYEMDTLMYWLNRRECGDPAGILKACGETLALDSLRGVLLCEERERSGIFSTALGLFGSYNFPELHQQSGLARFSSLEFLNSSDTFYVVSPSHIQKLIAPVIVGVIDEVKNTSFALSSSSERDSRRLPLALILDEMANIAPLGSISSILSEGASQKVMLLGALQDLSQARMRWGEASKGFLTLFGSALVFPGISDVASLNQLSQVSGKVEYDTVSRSYGGSLAERFMGPRGITKSKHFRPLLEPWEIARSKGGQGYLFRRSHEVRTVTLRPFEGMESIALPTWRRT